jgi:LPXTG-motif cell wall-anchored protein
MRIDRRDRGGVRLGVGAVLAALLATITVLLTGPGAQAYPESVCTVSVHPQRVVGGNPITVTGSSTVSHTWTFRFNGQTATGKGATFTHKFQTPKVTSERTIVVHAQCSGGAEQQIPVVVEPANAAGPQGGSTAPDHNGILPGTGGPALWILLAALALLLLGLGVVDVRRRNRANPWDTAAY